MIGRVRRVERPAVVPLHDVVVQGQYAQDNDGGNFLICDNQTRNRRMIAFASDDCLRHLVNNERWYVLY